MAIFMVGYDLHAGQNYKNLEDAIKSIGNWWHCLDSTWLVETSLTSAQVRDYLLAHIKSDDRLLVMSYGSPMYNLGGQAAWYGFNKNCEDWLRSNL